jgi:hypothetical protein
MAKGFIYRRKQAQAADLRNLLAQIDPKTFLHGWTWDPTQMHSLATGIDPLACQEGRAANNQLELRWRKEGKAYDILLLSLKEQQFAGFEPLTAVASHESSWQVEFRPYRLRRPAEAQNDNIIQSACFIAPNGATQFVALINN